MTWRSRAPSSLPGSRWFCLLPSPPTISLPPVPTGIPTCFRGLTGKPTGTASSRATSCATGSAASGCSGLPLQFSAVSAMPASSKIPRYSSRAPWLASSASIGRCGMGTKPPLLISAPVRFIPFRMASAAGSGLSCRQAGGVGAELHRWSFRSASPRNCGGLLELERIAEERISRSCRRIRMPRRPRRSRHERRRSPPRRPGCAGRRRSSRTRVFPSARRSPRGRPGPGR